MIVCDKVQNSDIDRTGKFWIMIQWLLMSTEWHVSLTLPPVLANATTELCELRPTIPSLFPVINAFEIIQGIKLNSIFAPENGSCFIPQVCQVCQSANGDSRIVGVEVVSFLSSAERQPTQPFPFKQVMPRFFPFFFPWAPWKCVGTCERFKITTEIIQLQWNVCHMKKFAELRKSINCKVSKIEGIPYKRLYLTNFHQFKNCVPRGHSNLSIVWFLLASHLFSYCSFQFARILPFCWMMDIISHIQVILAIRFGALL